MPTNSAGFLLEHLWLEMSRAADGNSKMSRAADGNSTSSTSSCSAGDATSMAESPSKAISEYIKLAKKKRDFVQSKKLKRKVSVRDDVLSYEDQLMIPIGRMYHCHKRKRGVLDKQYVTQTVVFRKDMNYKRVLEKCISSVFPDDDVQSKEFDFYVANGRGMCISNSEYIRVDNEDGQEECVPWTLQTYIKLSSIRYASKARFYCVKRFILDDHGDAIEDETEVPHMEEPGDQDEPTGQRRLDVVEEIVETEGQGKIDDKEESVEEEGITAEDEQEPYDLHNAEETAVYDPLFAYFKKSRYADKHLMKSHLSQRDALEHVSEHDEIDEFSESAELLLPYNPCHFGLWLVEIRNVKSMESIMELVADYDLEKGEVIYKTPVEGSKLRLWTGVEVSRKNHVALLMCVAVDGFHSVSSYKWCKDGCTLKDEVYPLLYANSCGKYKCSVTARMEEISHFFEVKGTNSEDFTAFENPANSDLLLPYRTILPDDCQSTKKVRLLTIIGQGSFGIVYRAVWRGLLVAAKVFQMGQDTGKVMGEVEKCRQLQHPNIVQVMGIEKLEQDKIAILMTFVDGPNLHDVIFSGNHKLNIINKIHIAIQLCQAVTFMHTNTPPMAHLDIKPSNVLVEKGSGKVFLGDFGLSQVMSGTNVIGTRTMLAGSPGFQSPEQLRNESTGLPSDVYALGALLLVLFGERPVWPTLAPFQIMYKVAVCHEKPETTHLPPHVQEVCNICFEEISCRPKANIVLLGILRWLHCQNI